MLVQEVLGVELELGKGMEVFIVIQVSHRPTFGLSCVPFHLVSFQDSPYGMFGEDEMVFVLQICSQPAIPEVSPLCLRYNEALTIRAGLLRGCLWSSGKVIEDTVPGPSYGRATDAQDVCCLRNIVVRVDQDLPHHLACL